jgi:hypothetical protein
MWAKGKSGNPGGRARTAPEALAKFREMARSCSKEALGVLLRVMRDADAKPEARTRAAEAVLAWSWGRPENALEVAGGPRDYAELPLGDQREIMRRALVAIDEKLSAGASEKGDAA